jgi:hypothetical protein
MNWNKVSDGLPEKPGEYLMVVKDLSNRRTIIYNYSSIDSWKGFPVTHWAEKPELPPDDCEPLCETLKRR